MIPTRNNLTFLLVAVISLLTLVDCTKKTFSGSAVSQKRGLDSAPVIIGTPILPREVSLQKTKHKRKKSRVRSSSTTTIINSDEMSPSGRNKDNKSSEKGPHGKQSWLAVASAVAHSAAATDSVPQTPTPEEASVSSRPTKYHYYPHNQHLYLLPECATQQVCSAVYLRLNYSQPLCACPNSHQPCSVSTRTDDRHTIPLVTGSVSQVLTLVKTCEPTREVRECRTPKDWSILALQNSRTGKAHYLVICRCPSPGFLEGPIAHSQPAYARVPGIRVYGMTCVRYPTRTGRDAQLHNNEEIPDLNSTLPWNKVISLMESIMELSSNSSTLIHEDNKL